MKKEAFSSEESSIETRIEPIKVSELDQFMAVAHQAIKNEPLPKDYESTKAASLRERTRSYYIKALFNSNDYTLLAAKDAEGKIFGVLEARIINMNGRKVGLVNLIGVSEDKRRHGTAMDLSRAYELILKKRKNVSGLMSGVFSTNRPSLGLRKKLGMTKISTKLTGDKIGIYYKALQ